MPSIWHLHLDAQPEQLAAHHVHAVLSQHLTHDHHARHQPFALSPPEAWGRGSRIELRLLRDEPAWVASCLAAVSAAVEHGLQIGVCTVRSSPGSRGAISGGLAEAWTDLLVAAKPAERFTVHFLSPYFVRDRNDTLVVPLPGSILRSLHDVWRHHAGIPAPPLRFDAANVVVDGLSGETVVGRHGSVSYKGFVGSVTYRVRNRDPRVRRAVNQLVLAARYSGLGSSTTFGFGTVDVECC